MRKLRFQVIACTGEDAAGPASLLNEHDSTGTGYLTPKNCEYPQELVMQLEGTCRLTQIQVLSHQSYIATKIELYLSMDNITYTRLGFLSLKSNKESQYTARELKTVHIDSTTRFVKFKLHQCYINEKNLYSQVGIVAINLNGEIVDEPSFLPDEIELGGALPSTPVKPMQAVRTSASMTPTKATMSSAKPPSAEDPAADLRFDAKTATKIKEIHAAKEKAVAMEDYDQAKRLKILEQQLMNIGLQLARLETAKRDAVANEDYDAAKRIKDEILELEASIGLPTPSSTSPATGRSSHGYDAPLATTRQNNPTPPQSSGSYNTTSPPPAAIPSVPKQRMQQQYDQPTSYEDAMERPLAAAAKPTQLKQQQSSASFSTPPDDDLNDDGSVAPAPVRKQKVTAQNAPAGGANPHFEGLPDCAEMADPEALPDSLLKESAEMVSVIGEYLTTCFYSNVWNHRDAAMRKVTLDLSNSDFTDSHDPHVVLSVVSTMVQSGVSDRIAQVSLTAVTMCDAMLRFAEGHALDPNAVVRVLNNPLVQLVNKLGESQAKIRDEVTASLLQLAGSDLVGPSVVATHLFRRASKKALPLKALQGRLGVVKALLTQFGLVPDFTLETVMGFLEENAAFAHQSKEIRDLAKAISVAIYQIVGPEIDPFLKTLRPKQMEEYQAAFETPEAKPLSVKKDKKAAAAPLPNARHRGAQHTAPPQLNADGGHESDDSNASVAEFTCPFCDRHDDAFDTDRLDQHFWAECPMLTQCKMCSQVIEISTLNEHLLVECEQKHNHKECPRCGEAITARFYEKHTSMNDCDPMPAPAQGNRCPLCHDDIGPRKRGWKAHLLSNKCPSNPRNS
ncbi:hypothetical protein H310_06987 [Aphanomyces invadans]|uniref:TOG domain-containing protein n=1 Tax=Aphanomyces invadans TaxID=157072 RepID=A0A024U505_9STRA|nr:hypothetical protein H310_06987 [Aphanomyces invadans]ETW01476.1 hypothetical protein H310_06987 [Aphanomyces invadans]|eukprot:XP_008870474.1 hypothetical protein H310_06987 [Aphanomyces invadans]